MAMGNPSRREYRQGMKRLGALTSFIVMCAILYPINKSYSADFLENSPISATIPIDETRTYLFNGNKGEVINVVSTGGGQSTASGFSGNCAIRDSNNSFIWSIDYDNDKINSYSFTPNYTGKYSLICSNKSREVAYVLFTFIENRQINLQTNIEAVINPLELRIFKFQTQKFQHQIIIAKGASQTTASGFSGRCDIKDAQNRYLWSTEFDNDKSSYYGFTPSYSGDHFLVCKNGPKEKAVVQFRFMQVDGIQPISAPYSINSNDLKVLVFKGEKDKQLTLFSRLVSGTAYNGYSANCEVRDGEGKWISSYFISSNTNDSYTFSPKYTGNHLLVCNNKYTKEISFTVGGAEIVGELKSSTTYYMFGGARPSGSSGATSGSTPSPQPSSTPSTPSGLSTVTKSVDQSIALSDEAKNQADDLVKNGFTEGGYKEALAAANKAIAAATKALAAAEAAAKSAKSSERSAAQSEADAAQKALEAARSAKEAANSAKAANSALLSVQDAAKSIDISNAPKTAGTCSKISTVVSSAAGVASVFLGPVGAVIAAIVSAIVAIAGSFKCKD